jgi:pimeloyl-ACP methyl ester carboxylesterase
LPIEQAGGVHLYYELTGNHGDNVVLIHGSWGDHNNWSLVVPGIAQSFRVLTYDRRGHSKSEKTHAQGSADEDADDLAALLTRLDAAPAHVVGSSFGGTIGLKLAIRRPDILRSLIIHEPPLYNLLRSDPSALPMLLQGRQTIEQAARMVESGDKVGGARLFTEALTLGRGSWERLPTQVRETMIANADTWLDETRDPNGTDIALEKLARFNKPTLLLYGGKGLPGSNLIVEKLNKAVPNSRVLFDPDEGHTPQISRPTEFVRRVTDFIQSTDQLNHVPAR